MVASFPRFPRRLFCRAGHTATFADAPGGPQCSADPACPVGTAASASARREGGSRQTWLPKRTQRHVRDICLRKVMSRGRSLRLSITIIDTAGLPRSPRRGHKHARAVSISGYACWAACTDRSRAHQRRGDAVHHSAGWQMVPRNGLDPDAHTVQIASREWTLPGDR